MCSSRARREYAMRIWIDPDKVAANNLNASEVLAALRAQNLQVSAGVLNQPPIGEQRGLPDQRRGARPTVHAASSSATSSSSPIRKGA